MLAAQGPYTRQIGDLRAWICDGLNKYHARGGLECALYVADVGCIYKANGHAL